MKTKYEIIEESLELELPNIHRIEWCMQVYADQYINSTETVEERMTCAYENGYMCGKMDNRNWWINRIENMIELVQAAEDIADSMDIKQGYANQEYILNELLKGIK